MVAAVDIYYKFDEDGGNPLTLVNEFGANGTIDTSGTEDTHWQWNANADPEISNLAHSTNDHRFWTSSSVTTPGLVERSLNVFQKVRPTDLNGGGCRLFAESSGLDMACTTQSTNAGTGDYSFRILFTARHPTFGAQPILDYYIGQGAGSDLVVSALQFSDSAHLLSVTVDFDDPQNVVARIKFDSETVVTETVSGNPDLTDYAFANANIVPGGPENNGGWGGREHVLFAVGQAAGTVPWTAAEMDSIHASPNNELGGGGGASTPVVPQQPKMIYIQRGI